MPRLVVGGEFLLAMDLKFLLVGGGRRVLGLVTAEDALRLLDDELAAWLGDPHMVVVEEKLEERADIGFGRYQPAVLDGSHSLHDFRPSRSDRLQ